MKSVSYLNKREDLGQFKSADVSELILGHKQLSRLGSLDTQTLHLLAEACQKQGIRSVLEWDILMTEPSFHQAKSVLSECDLSKFDAIRVQDPGALAYVMREIPNIPIQLILENGNHNLEGMKKWCAYVGNHLDRLVLSIELSKPVIERYLKQLSVPVELLGLGQILLFYTPRNLLSAQAQKTNEKILEATVSSEEISHKDFKVIENKHGTFMFHPKEYFLLSKVKELASIGVTHLRLDFRFSDNMKYLSQAMGLFNDSSNQKVADFKQNYPSSLFHCFYENNRTDILFSKLKNQSAQRQDCGYMGEVVEVQRGSYMVLKIKHPTHQLKTHMSVKFLTPEGKSVETKITEMKNSDLETIESAKYGDLVLIPSLKKVSIRSRSYGV